MSLISANGNLYIESNNKNRMRRQPDHVIQFLFSELGTSGSIDGNQRLVIKGRFQQKQVENVLKRYIGMEVIYIN